MCRACAVVVLSSSMVMSEIQQILILLNQIGSLSAPQNLLRWLARHFFGGNLSYIGFGGSGKQVRDLLHVADFADLVILQLQNIKQQRCQIYNVGGGTENSISLLELTNIFKKLTNREIKINVNKKERPGDLLWFITNSRKIKEATGWEPKCTINITLYEIHKWIEKTENS